VLKKKKTSLPAKSELAKPLTTAMKEQTPANAGKVASVENVRKQINERS
jgi:hypothetical protein